MSDEHAELVESIFQRAADLPAGEREAFLAEACAAQPEIRAEVEDLLARTSAEARGFLRSPVLREEALPGELEPGDIVGARYKILRVLGEGGLGRVWLAEQIAPVRRDVALKVVKLGMDTREVLARFETERNALTIMDHPGVARVYDAGVTDHGRPFFVMEYVPGVPLTEYCDHELLTTTERLRLFAKVCAAVQHAHQKGVIHRDLKPSNILVALTDGEAVPKIIDFGIAKATARKLTEATLSTEHGQIMGTPDYMSPEQAEMSGLGVDTRTDIYSLGVILYELLTGVLPFDPATLREGGLSDIQRIIREEEPARPSTRLSKLGDSTSLIVMQRRSDTKTLRRELAGDLDWIVMMAIEKQRRRRYASASEFAADIERYLGHRPLHAGPPTAVYRMRKFLRRNRVGVAFAAVVAMLLVGGIVGTATQMVRANARRADAERATAAALEAKTDAEARRREADEARTAAERLAYRASVIGAASALRAGDVLSARPQLALAPDDLRDWEWRHLSWHADRSRRRLAIGPFQRLAVSRDDRYLAADDFRGHLRILDFATGAVLREVVVAHGDATIFFRGRTNEHLGVIRWDPVGHGARAAGLLEWRTGAWLWRQEFDPSSVTVSRDVLVVHPRGTHTIRMLDVETGAEQRVLEIAPEYGFEGRSPDGDYLGQPAISSDGRFVVCRQRPWIKVLDARTGETVTRVRADDARWSAVLFHPDRKHIAFGVATDVVIVEIESGREVLRIQTKEIAERFTFWRGGNYIVTIGLRDARIWDAHTGGAVTRLAGRFLTFTGDREAIVMSPEAGRIEVVDGEVSGPITPVSYYANLSRPERDLDLPPEVGAHVVDCAVFSPDRHYVACGGWGHLKLFDTQTGAEVWSNYTLAKMFHGLAFSPDGTQLAAGGRNHTVAIVDAASGRVTTTFAPLPSVILSLAWTGDRLFAGAESGAIHVLDAATGREITVLRDHGSPVHSLAVSPDGALLASGSGDWLPYPRTTPRGSDHSVRVRDARSGASIATLAGHHATVRALAFSGDGRRLVSGDGAGHLRLWDVGTGWAATVLQDRGSRISAATFTPGGTRVVTAGIDHLVRFWDTRSGEHVVDLPLPWASRRPEFRALAYALDDRLLGSTVSAFLVDFETGPPRAGGSREQTRAAYAIVNALFGELSFCDDVIARVEADSTLAAPLRGQCLALARARGDHLSWFISDTIIHVMYDADPDPVGTLRRAQVVYAESRMPEVLLYLGAAQYRLGRYEDALESLNACAGVLPDDAIRHAFLAMTQHRLGFVAEASAALALARRAMQDGDVDARTRHLVAEAEALLSASSRATGEHVHAERRDGTRVRLRRTNKASSSDRNPRRAGTTLARTASPTIPTEPPSSWRSAAPGHLTVDLRATDWKR